MKRLFRFLFLSLGVLLFCKFTVGRKFLTVAIPVLTGLFFEAAFAQWSDDPSVNVAISRSFSQEQHPLTVSDGADGAIIVWESHDGIDFDLLAQRVDASGKVVWTSSASISFLLADQRDPSIISDGTGGAIVVWLDKRDDPVGGDIYAQRVDASGNVKWAVNGIPICTATNVQAYPKIVSDGAGGALITWRDSRNFLTTGVDIYAQRVDASGNVKWTANGVPICATGGDQLDPVIVSDGAGGAVIAWMDDRDSTTGWDIYAQRVNGSGVTQWAANGVGYKANGNQTWKPLSPPIVSDGAGGAIIAWEDDFFGTADVDIRCLRVNSSGSFPWSPASSWIAGANGNQVFPQLTSDGSGGAIITWVDYRNGVTNPDIYAQRVNSSGGALWTGDWGKPICAAADRQELPRIVRDAQGGAIITWHDYRNTASTGVDVYAQRIDGSGNVKWTSNGTAISTASNHQYDPTLVRVDTCDAIIAWYDYRWVGDPTDDTDWDIYAQRVFCDGSLKSPNNTPNGSNVQVTPGNGVTLTFDSVTSSGNTTVNTKTSGPPPPGGFTIIPAGASTYYSITTTATFSGNVKICIQYNNAGLTPAQEAALKLQVYESPPGQWQNITSSLDMQNNIICGTVNHLSDFAVMFGATHFTFASNTGESYSMVIDNATLDGNQLANGDEIGVFTPAGLCVGAAVWDGTTPLALTAWADDSQTNDVDGYKNGEKMLFEIWDASTGTQDDYPATATYSVGNGNFGDGAFARLSLTAVTSVTQALALQKGWSWVSFNVAPADLSMENIMASVNNLVIVVNGAGQFYIPTVINSIGQLNVLEGYKIYVSAPDQVSVTGKPVTATTPIALKAGWNFVSYLPSAAMSAETALASVLSQLAIVKNDAGKFFIPNVINSLGNMTPGESYKLYLNADATLIYPQGSSSAKVHSNTLAKQSANASHFAFTQRTGESFSVVVKSSGPAFKPGDEIGIFTPAGLCVGAGVCDGSGILGLSAWADNDRTDAVDGFREGEKMHFKLWDANKSHEVTLKAIFTSGSDRFDGAPFSVVELESPALPKTFSLGQNYPNPFNAGTVISYRLPESGKVTLTVYNLLGEPVRVLLNEDQEAGAYSIHWDGKDWAGRFVSSGVYVYRIQAGSHTAVRKAVFVK